MAASLGMLGIGSFSATVAPGNFREAILREYPQGGAVFTMILGMLPSESVNSRKFTWFEQGLPQQRFAIASSSGGGSNADDTTFVLSTTLPIANTNPAYSFKVGHLARIESTGEIVLVVNKGTTATTELVVKRGVGNSGTGIIFTDGATLSIVGHTDQEGADVPSAINYQPTEEYNLIQTFRTALDLTDDAAQEYYRTGDIMKNEKFDKAMDHALDQERAFVWGKRDTFTATTGFFQTGGTGLPHRMLGGLWHFLGNSTYSTDFTATGLTKTGFNNFLKPIYTVQNGSMNKVAFCGASFLQAINDYAEQNSAIQTEPGDKTYGLTIRTLYHPWGELKLIPHPLLSEHADWSKMAFIVDLKNVKYRFLRNRDTRFLLERQGNGEDRVTHEFMTKCSLELRFPRTHGIAYGVSEYVA